MSEINNGDMPRPSRNSEGIAAAVDAALAFDKDTTYLSHPKVRPYLGTENGDSPEAWQRDYATKLCQVILDTFLARSETATKMSWTPWTEKPPVVDEPTAYAVLTHRGDGSHEGFDDLKLGMATWGPALQHSGLSNWPDRIGCEWDRMYVRYWFPVDIGASCKELLANLNSSGERNSE